MEDLWITLGEAAALLRRPGENDDTRGGMRLIELVRRWLVHRNKARHVEIQVPDVVRILPSNGDTPIEIRVNRAAVAQAAQEERDATVPESPEAARAEPLASPAAADRLSLPEAVLTVVRLLPDGPKLASVMTSRSRDLYDDPKSVEPRLGPECETLLPKTQEARKLAESVLRSVLKGGRVHGTGTYKLGSQIDLKDIDQDHWYRARIDFWGNTLRLSDNKITVEEVLLCASDVQRECRSELIRRGVAIETAGVSPAPPTVAAPATDTPDDKIRERGATGVSADAAVQAGGAMAVAAQRKPKGRKPYDRQVIREWVFSIMNQRGAFEVTGREWNQARLVEALEDAFEVSRSTAYILVPPLVEQWQLSRRSRK